MDSSGVGAYVAAFRRARSRGTSLVIGQRSPAVDRVLELSGVEEAGVELVYEPPWSPERMTEDARWELGIALAAAGRTLRPALQGRPLSHL